MTTRTCIICGSTFTPQNSAIITCSKECSAERKRRYTNEYNRAKYQHRGRGEGGRNGRRETDDDALRRQCIEGTERYRRALVAAGYTQFAKEKTA
jgi:hypothetical protein